MWAHFGSDWWIVDEADCTCISLLLIFIWWLLLNPSLSTLPIQPLTINPMINRLLLPIINHLHCCFQIFLLILIQLKLLLICPLPFILSNYIICTPLSIHVSKWPLSISIDFLHGDSARRWMALSLAPLGHLLGHWLRAHWVVVLGVFGAKVYVKSIVAEVPIYFVLIPNFSIFYLQFSFHIFKLFHSSFDVSKYDQKYNYNDA